MKKKLAALLLALSVLTLMTGCGDKKEEPAKDEKETESSKEDDTEDTTEKVEITDKDGNVVSVNIKDIEKYMTLGEYKNLEVDKNIMSVSDEEVMNYINSQLKYSLVEVTEDREVKEGDTVNIDYEGKKDGVAFDGGTAQGTDLEIGSHSFIDGFEDGLIGTKKGQTVDLNLTFPEDYRNTDLAGAEVVFTVTVNSISQPSDLTDEWVAANTEAKTIDEYKEMLREQLQMSSDSNSDAQLKSDLFSIVVEATKISEYPKAALEAEKENYKKQVEQIYANPNGMTLDEFREAQQMSKEDFDKIVDEAAQAMLQQKMIVQGIMNAEQIKISKEDFDKDAEEFAKENGFENLDAMLEIYDEALIRDNILWNKVCEVIMETAKITEKEAKTE